ncbi:MAG: flagellar assembly protein FliW [Firmicutes bacterium HGW-Firmicutes-8]|nr:MAG: flagellar assembly protein FliW [Firmicutes bacterium HGW-Firmicutes-8]
MIVETRRFGNIDIPEKDLIIIAGGVLGFEGIQKFVLLDHDSETPFKWLQAVDNPELAFVVMEPFIFCPDYQFDLSDSDIEEIGLSKPEEAVVLTILVIPEDPKKMSANIKAPIVINQTNKKGKQIVLNNDEYPIKFYLFREEKKSQGGR